jgi:hypothetical protein
VGLDFIQISADNTFMSSNILKIYDEIKTVFKENKESKAVSHLFHSLYYECENLLQIKEKMPLNSQIPNKDYFSFTDNMKLTRPINKNLYDHVSSDMVNNFFESLKNASVSEIKSEDITAIVYRIAIDFCAVIDILKQSDQKTPGTYFEYFMGHLFSLNFEVKPRNQMEVLNLDMKTKLPTDFIFDLGQNKPKFHVPVKTSTRERVVQVWAHQRVLDGVYGNGRFIGLLTCLAETKLDHKTREVIEICLPDQWRLYQLFISQLKRVYYLDIPHKYLELNNFFPKIHVKQFGEFFHEKELLVE